jgi:hypothetical protein
MGPLHVALCGAGTWVEVLRDSFGGEIGAPFEEATSDCFEECRDMQAAHQLMGKLDAVGLGLTVWENKPNSFVGGFLSISIAFPPAS